MARGRRNYDAAARPGPLYETEHQIVAGRTKIKRPKKLKQDTEDTRTKLPWRSQHG